MSHELKINNSMIQLSSLIVSYTGGESFNPSSYIPSAISRKRELNISTDVSSFSPSFTTLSYKFWFKLISD